MRAKFAVPVASGPTGPTAVFCSDSEARHARHVNRQVGLSRPAEQSASEVRAAAPKGFRSSCDRPAARRIASRASNVQVNASRPARHRLPLFFFVARGSSHTASSLLAKATTTPVVKNRVAPRVPRDAEASESCTASDASGSWSAESGLVALARVDQRPENAVTETRPKLPVNPPATVAGWVQVEGVTAGETAQSTGPNQFRRGPEGTTDRAGGGASPANKAPSASRQRQRNPGLRASGLTGGAARDLLVVARRRHHHEASSGRIFVPAEPVPHGVVEALPPAPSRLGAHPSYARERGRSGCSADPGAVPGGSTRELTFSRFQTRRLQRHETSTSFREVVRVFVPAKSATGPGTTPEYKSRPAGRDRHLEVLAGDGVALRGLGYAGISLDLFPALGAVPSKSRRRVTHSSLRPDGAQFSGARERWRAGELPRSRHESPTGSQRSGQFSQYRRAEVPRVDPRGAAEARRQRGGRLGAELRVLAQASGRRPARGERDRAGYFSGGPR